MNNLELFLTIVAMGLVTFAIRFSLIGLENRLTLSETVKRGLKFVPNAVLSSIIFPKIFCEKIRL